MSTKNSIEIYNELFSNDEEKARAFDLIAQRYYYTNFGSISKSDMDTLMFSIYIEQILQKSEDDWKTYSDYQLSKNLGITQTRISNLKVKKELQYPYEKFSWKDSLCRIADNAIYEDGKIKLYIPDRNLYLEIKNSIEEDGGYIDVQLNRNLLQIRLEYFLDLLVSISDEKDKKVLCKKIRKKMQVENKHIPIVEKRTFGQMLKGEAPETICKLIGIALTEFTGPTLQIGKIILNMVNEHIIS